MKKRKNSDLDMPRGKLVRVPDFLPSPSDLVMPTPTVKITIALNKDSVDFFKREAKKHHTKYQKMIRVLLDMYASQITSKSKK